MNAVIFDLDGTLADSVADIAAALNVALSASGLAPFDVPAVTSMVGAGARRLIERALAARHVEPTAALVDAQFVRFIAAYDAHPCVHTQLYPGTRAVLSDLASAGWLLGVCTNKPQGLAQQVMSHLGIAALFGVIVGGRDGLALKPAPDMVFAALASLGVAADRAVFVGDSAADVGAARAAGLPVIVMTHGYSDRPADTLGADAVAEDMAALQRALLQRAGMQQALSP